MPALRQCRRGKTAREIAEKVGISERTVVRMIAEPRGVYEQRARQRRAAAVQLRLQGRTYREIADLLGITTGIVGHVLATARSKGEWRVAVERRTHRHTE